uniref:Uncharacterized protein n=1 Tax=Romanomermis culicivorax TaxID=13658 RepID=A0A915HKA1_ROMCU
MIISVWSSLKRFSFITLLRIYAAPDSLRTNQYIIERKQDLKLMADCSEDRTNQLDFMNDAEV